MKQLYVLLTLLMFLVHGVQSQNKAGMLDSSFGNDGKVVSENYQGIAYASLLQPDGKIIIGGGGSYYKGDTLIKGSLLARYNTNGSPDLGFADSGRGAYILGDSGSYIPTIRSMALQPDGKIVALGNFAVQKGVFGPFSLMRFNPDGSADESFGIKGLMIGNISGGLDGAFKVALLKDGRIIVVGQLHEDVNDFGRNFIACYTQQGNFDRAFGDTGVAIISLEQPAAINSVAITSDDKIIVGGLYSLSPGYEILLKYKNNGTPDLSFGENGLAKMSFSDPNNGIVLNDIVIDMEGKIVTGGVFYLQHGKATIKVGRFTKEGFPDNDFSADGYTYTPYANGDAYANSVAVQQNGKIVTTGYYAVGDSGVFTVIRYNSDGSLDSGFGINGIQNTSFFGQDIAYSVNIQNDGKIVLAGQAVSEIESEVGIARYNGDESRKQILITKIRRWLQHHNGIVWDDVPGIKSYAVQRSADGVKWNTVYRSPITANSQSTINYYNDASPLPGTNYYRLQTTSIDGAVAYSNVITINSEPLAISLSPNPAQNVLHIEGLSSSQRIKVTVVDLGGNEACSVQLSASSSSYNLNIAALKPGNYLLKLEVNGEVVTKQFVKE